MTAQKDKAYSVPARIVLIDITMSPLGACESQRGKSHKTTTVH